MGFDSSEIRLTEQKSGGWDKVQTQVHPEGDEEELGAGVDLGHIGERIGGWNDQAGGEQNERPLRSLARFRPKPSCSVAPLR